jgi:hypothetical protein
MMPAKRDVFQIKGRSTIRTAGNKVYVRPKPLSSTHIAKPKFPDIKPVQGIMPDSKEEYWCALALYKLKLDFVFQKHVMGGRSGRGGQVVDFWVYTAPLPTPIYIQGDYWHYANGRGYQSQLNIAKLKAYYGASIAEPVEILTSTTPTPEAMYLVVKRVCRQ